MQISEGFPVTFRGAPAQLHILRNDGYCWGRLVTASGEQFDVSPAEEDLDLYDYADGDAATVLETTGVIQPITGAPI
jgi:hypothetical protein